MMFFIICGEDFKYLSSNSSRPPRSSEKKEWLKNGGKNIFLILCVSLVAKWWLFLNLTQKTLLLLFVSSGWMLFGGLHVIRADSRKEKTDKGF